MTGRVDVIVPCFNEAERLDVTAYGAFLDVPGPVRFIFVDDGSTDATSEKLEAIREDHPERVKVIALERNAGKSEAVRRGVLGAFEENPWAVGYWDADLATPLDAIADLISVLETHPSVEVVFGSRVRLLGRRIERRPARHYLGRVFATLASLLLDLPVYDTQCGAKLMRNTSRVRALFNRPFLWSWVFDVELVARFLEEPRGEGVAAPEAIYEFPLRLWQHQEGSKVRATDFFRALTALDRIRRAYPRHRRDTGNR